MILDYPFFHELWVFPLYTKFGMWLGITALYLLGSGEGQRRAIYRAVVSVAGAYYFLFQAGLWGVGVLALLLPPILWWATDRLGAKGLGVIAPLLIFFAIFGHFPLHVGPDFAAEIARNGRLSIHVFALFFFFRLLSFGIATGMRRERVSLMECVEYFFAPPFLLEPGKGFMTTFATFREPVKRARDRLRGVLWIGQGLLFQGVFIVGAEKSFHFLNMHYAEGLSPWRLSWIMTVGCSAFLLTYVEKARMSYTLAGLLRLSGRAIEPDFRAPWMAKSLLDYWRRFHYWVLEFYVETLYQPLSYYLSQRLSARTAVALGIFLTFTLGTALSHFLYYSAPLSVALVLGFLFGLCTMAHYLIGYFLRRFAEQWGWLGIPVTWLTVGLLYAIAYPAFGLGWGWREIVDFFC